MVPLAFPLSALLALMAVSITVWLAGTYIGRRLLVVVVMISTAVVLVAATCTFFDPLVPIPLNMRLPLMIIVNVVATFLVGSIAFAFSFSSHRLCRPGLIVLDLMMPEIDGFEFVATLQRSEWRTIPVVVITAKELTPDDHKRLQGGVSWIFEKGSYRFDDLLGEIRRLLVTVPDSMEWS